MKRCVVIFVENRFSHVREDYSENLADLENYVNGICVGGLIVDRSVDAYVYPEGLDEILETGYDDSEIDAMHDEIRQIVLDHALHGD